MSEALLFEMTKSKYALQKEILDELKSTKNVKKEHQQSTETPKPNMLLRFLKKLTKFSRTPESMNSVACISKIFETTHSIWNSEIKAFLHHNETFQFKLKKQTQQSPTENTLPSVGQNTNNTIAIKNK